MTARRLLASIHDVTPFHAARLERLVPLVEEALGPGRYALLVVPDFHRQGLLTGDPRFARRLRGWAEAGCEIFLHGFTHVDESRHAGVAARWKASRMTAGEGEFLGLSTREAEVRILEGRDMIEQLTGRPIAGFVAPAWLYGEDSLAALAAQNIRLIEDHFRVWNPQNSAVFARGPVVTYASRSRARIASSILWSRLATILLARASTVRLAVHPHDVDSPRLMREIARALAAFARSHQPAAYADLASSRFS
jgi:predicted deacetylase